MDISGTTVLLTGASSGLGAATARVLAARGARLLLAGRNTARLLAVAAETGGIALEADLSAPDGAEALAASAIRATSARNLSDDWVTAGSMLFRSGPAHRHKYPKLSGSGRPPADAAADGNSAAGPRAPDNGSVHALTLSEQPMRVRTAAPRLTSGNIDILINNAGIGWAGPLTEMSAAKVAQLVAVNLTAPIELTRLLTPALAAGGRGSVVFISSIAGATGVTQEAVYAATKAGLGCFAESLRYELAAAGVGVSVVVPGVVDTPFFARRGRPYSRRKPVAISAHHVAKVVVTAIEREQPVAFAPRWLSFPAWLHGAAPGTFRMLAARFG